MSQAVADRVRGRCGVIAVNNTFQLAPDAEALVAADKAWWLAHPEALQFKGRKFCGVRLAGTEKLAHSYICPGGSNSGLRGMECAFKEFSAELILLLGFDMRGLHYFGAHRAPLRNPTTERLATFIRQFRRWSGCPVINCTPGSALTQFPFGDLDEALRTG